MKVEIEPILIEQKSVFIQLMELYNYDFSEFSEDDIDEQGYFGYEHIDDYFIEEGRRPFFIRVDGNLAGLVLVRACCDFNEMNNSHNIAEFFVMKKYRRLGVGQVVATTIFDKFRGNWEISIWTNNLPAKSFWEKVVKSYTKDNYRSFSINDKSVEGFVFEN